MRKINIKLLLSLIFLSILPSIYLALRINFLGSYPDANALSIASQQQWLGIIYEVFNEAIIFPMFFFFGKIDDKPKFINKIRNSILLILILYLLMALFINIFSLNLVSAMRQNEALYYETSNYIKLESFANIFIIIFQLLIVVNVVIYNYKDIIIISILKTIITIILDLLFVSNYSFSLNIGVNAIAYNNILSNLFSIIVILILLSRKGYNIFDKSISFNFVWYFDIIKLSFISGFESFYRNFIYSIMVIRMINISGDQGDYWIINNFFWGWLLVPALQLGEIVKNDFSKDYNTKLKPYIILNTLFVALWLLLIPLYKFFIKDLYNVKDYETILHVIMIYLPFYIIFSYGNIITNLFYAIGKPHLVLLQSFIVNTVFNGIFFILYLKGIFVPSIMSVTFRFGAVIIIASLINFIIYFIIRKNLIKEQVI